MSLACAMLYVRDLGRMRAFYEKVLQAHPVNTQWTDTWAFFDLQDAGFALHAIPVQHSAPVDPTAPAPPREQSPLKLIFAVDDIGVERARLQALGVTILSHAWQDPAGSCDCVDPEGNIFQVAARASLPRLFGRE